jgi:hypothetical protein
MLAYMSRDGITSDNARHLKHIVKADYGRAVAQAVSRRLPTTAARVRAQVKSGHVGQSGTGTGFPQVHRFPLPLILPTAPYSLSSSSRAGTICQIVDSFSPHQRKVKIRLIIETAYLGREMESAKHVILQSKLRDDHLKLQEAD